jgi:ADP-ribosylglycohydrolase
MHIPYLWALSSFLNLSPTLQDYPGAGSLDELGRRHPDHFPGRLLRSAATAALAGACSRVFPHRGNRRRPTVRSNMPPTAMTYATQDRAQGLLLGLAAGDRIGGPLRLALHVAESLVARGRFARDNIGSRYLGWWRQGSFDTGPIVSEVLRLVDAGFSFDDAAAHADVRAKGLTAGCNPAHRSAPLAMLAALPDTELATAAIAEAHLTHRHPLAGDVAAAVTVLCRALIRGHTWQDAVARAADGRLPETRQALGDTRNLSDGGFSPDALRAAVHFVGTSDSMQQALLRSIEFAGQANYCPVLVGSIGGARWGANSVPATLLTLHDELLPRLASVADTLARGWHDDAWHSRSRPVA